MEVEWHIKELLVVLIFIRSVKKVERSLSSNLNITLHNVNIRAGCGDKGKHNANILPKILRQSADVAGTTK